MTWPLFRQDPALQTLYATVPISLSLGILIRFSVSEDTLARLAESPPIEWPDNLFLPGIIIWLTFPLLLVTAGFWSRCSGLHMALPISTRRLWLVRILAIITATLVPVAGMIMIFAIHLPDSGLLPVLIPNVTGLGVRIGAGLVFMMIAYQSLSPGLRQISIGLWQVVFFILVAAAALIYLIMSPVSILFALLPLVLSVALGLRMFLTLPAAFSLDTFRITGRRKIETSRSTAVGYREQQIIDPRGILHLAILRTFTTHPIAWFLLPVAAAESLIATVRYYEGEHYLLFAIFAVMFLWIMVGIAIQKLSAFDHLPVSRRLLHMYALLPYVLVVSLTIGITCIITTVVAPEITEVRYRNHHLQVPPEFWEITTSGRAPVVSSPWGETYQPVIHRLAGSRGPGVYNPFDHDRDNSARFARLQEARAIEAVHGVSVPAKPSGEYSESSVDAEDIKRECCLVVEQSVGLTSPVRGRILAIILTGLALTGTLLFHLSIRAARPTALRPLYISAFPSIGIIVVLGLFYSILGERFGFSSMNAIGTFPMILARQLTEALPFHTTLMWSLAAVILGALYHLSVRAFTGAESPRNRNSGFLDEYSN